ncbi:YhcH/YjgK/YiaL family protein [Pelagicoccus sp. SDUM812002]|uniref:YhcH/YjgK/YiaL family protein n=1 Tax=Pelagicoccus sp. SDUM812002 TaxID=3041266 RepID=UPI00280E3DD0|nr:YhcH/YjgK/YiaL family protein [Pelagicoccus sp. SDUM812002]MDQ8186022.1 YhcH/YjgK/YiaL family protein [Pelagicoccus sp. SDUM812002]
MIVDHINNWKQYSLGEAWEKVFHFLENLSVDADEKEYPIDWDEIFARVMSYQTKEDTDPQAVLEAHRKYADVQMALVGSERIAVYPTHTLGSKGDYLPERDVEFFEYEIPAGLQLSMHPGTFALLLPQDAHMPGLFTETKGAEVKKVVVKVLLERLTL